MGKKIVIKTEEEKKQFIDYIEKNILPEGLIGYKKRNFIEKAKSMQIQENRLCIYNRGLYKIIIGEWEVIEAKLIIYKNHLPGHISSDKLYDKISAEYAGITRNMIRKYVKRCEVCSMAGTLKNKDDLKYITAVKIHERLFIDLIDLSTYEGMNEGYKYIMTCIDSYSKFAFGFPLKNKSAISVSENLDNLCAVEGKWDIIHTDNGKEFCNGNFKDICAKYNMQHKTGRPRHPESQGQVERFNGTLKKRLAKSLFGSEKKWIRVMRDIIHQYNNTTHRATKNTPFSIFRNIILTESKIHQIYTDINVHVRSSAEIFRYQENVYKNSQKQTFNIGDRVLLTKDFDTNVKTRKDSLEMEFYEKVYVVIRSEDENISISDDNGNVKCVRANQLKKLNN